MDADTGTFKRKKKLSKTCDASSGSKIQQLSKLPKPKYPIEDSELPIYSRKAHPEMETSAVPKPKNEYTIREDDMPKFISVWTALFVYAYFIYLFF